MFPVASRSVVSRLDPVESIESAELEADYLQEQRQLFGNFQWHVSVNPLAAVVMQAETVDYFYKRRKVLLSEAGIEAAIPALLSGNVVGNLTHTRIKKLAIPTVEYYFRSRWKRKWKPDLYHDLHMFYNAQVQQNELRKIGEKARDLVAFNKKQLNVLQEEGDRFLSPQHRAEHKRKIEVLKMQNELLEATAFEPSRILALTRRPEIQQFERRAIMAPLRNMISKDTYAFLWDLVWDIQIDPMRRTILYLKGQINFLESVIKKTQDEHISEAAKKNLEFAYAHINLLEKMSGSDFYEASVRNGGFIESLLILPYHALDWEQALYRGQLKRAELIVQHSI